MSEVAIHVEQLSKRYRIGASRNGSRTLREQIVESFAAPVRRLGSVFRGNSTFVGEESIWALKDVSFDVKRGEVVGIIGRNGSGKSTLLKLLSRITEPTLGYAETHGRVASLLEVGTGFHPELTGRENIYLNSAILGMRRTEIVRRFDEIVAFAEVEKFIDTPVKHYSSGMYLRLAFSVAAHLEPEILLVDEVLAVGDAAFQRKCLGKMGEVARQGRTILFVSHNMGAVSRLCSRAVLLNDGRVLAQGPTQDVTRRYLTSSLAETRKCEVHIEERPDLSFQIISVAVTNAEGDLLSRAGLWDSTLIRVSYLVKRRLHGSNLAVWVSRDGNTIFESFDTDLSPDQFAERAPGYYRAVIPVPTGLLPVGTYTVSLATGLTSVGVIDAHRDVLSFEVVADDEDVTHKSYSRGGMVMAKLAWKTETLSSLISCLELQA